MWWTDTLQHRHSASLFSLSFDFHSSSEPKVSHFNLQIVIQKEVAQFKISVNHLKSDNHTSFNLTISVTLRVSATNLHVMQVLHS